MGKVNFTELVVEASVKRLAEDETILEQQDATVAALVEKTHQLLREMLTADTEWRRDLRNEVVMLNMRLVTVIVKKYGTFSPDRFQNGCIGLLKAAETYRFDTGVPFKNYACLCIEMEIRMAWKKQNRSFESKNKDFMSSLDDQARYSNGDEQSNHDIIEDTWAEGEFDQLIEADEMQTLFYDIIIPVVEQYGVRSKGLDMDQWKALEIRYFLELSQVSSQQQRLTFKAMAEQLGTATQNIRTRHKKVLAMVRKRCEEYGFAHYVSNSGKSSVYRKWDDVAVGKQR